MDPQLQKTHDLLKSISTTVRNSGLSGTFREHWGWNHPLLSKEDIATSAEELIEKISPLLSSQTADSIDPNISAQLKELNRRIELFKGDVLQYIFNGNANSAVPIYQTLIASCNKILSQINGWAGPETIQRKQSEAIKNFHKLQTQFEAISKDAEGLAEKVTSINEAKETADSLPATLQSLQKTSQTLIGHQSKAQHIEANMAALEKRVDANMTALEKKGQAIVEALEAQNQRAEEILNKASSAYSAATSKGLSEAFYQRSEQLHKSMRWWVGGLAIALIATLSIGLLRFSALSEALKAPGTPWYNIAIQIFMAFIGIAAPVWFAWLASKQMGHLFKVSEDYAYKASVAKAYEGFRLETLKYDQKFAEQLLSSAMERLDEEPLRFVDPNNHASPLNELVQSPLTKAIVDKIPTSARKPIKKAATESDDTAS